MPEKLSPEYANKKSRARYNELNSAFPDALILFGHEKWFFGFDKTAVALYILFQIPFYRKDGMLVSKCEKIEFLKIAFISPKFDLKCIIDCDGKLTLMNGKKIPPLKPLSFYEELQSKEAKRNPSNANIKARRNQTYTYSNQGWGWNNSGWSPGLPSARFNRRKK
ncbi:MAG: hypothetical protein IKS28_03535 [Clostridia bacterium]|nr:hypothetical protein [Clostridia bacterium]